MGTPGGNYETNSRHIKIKFFLYMKQTQGIYGVGFMRW